MAGEGEVVEIFTTENYGRAKRASMLYSAALVVLGFAISTKSTVEVSWLGMDLPFQTAKLFTWAAALYYTIIFVFEWRIAHLINSKAMQNDAGGGITSRLRELSDRFNGYSVRIVATSEAYISAVESVRGNISQFKQVVETEKLRPFDSLPLQYTSTSVTPFPTAQDIEGAFTKYRDRLLASTISPYENILKTDAQIVDARAKENIAVYQDIAASLKALLADFTKLAARFTTEQRIMFYWLDLTAAVILFLAGTGFAVVAFWKLIR